MNNRSFITSPVLPCLLFCFILISGESFGGLYLTYILNGLSSLQWHAILGFAGLLCLIIGQWIRPVASGTTILYLLGLGSLVSSLVFFFASDAQHYNEGTFTQPLPLLTIVLFGLSSIIFLNGLVRSRR